MINTRNKHGVKFSIDTYLNIKGKQYTQWTDYGGDTLIEAKANIYKYKLEYPNAEFIARKQKEGYYRIYYRSTLTK